jgi:hypothetical protein
MGRGAALEPVWFVLGAAAPTPDLDVPAAPWITQCPEC